MSAADRIRVQHMRDAAAEAMQFVKGHTVDDLRSNRMLLLSLVKEIGIAGEAATSGNWRECLKDCFPINIATPHHRVRMAVGFRELLKVRKRPGIPVVGFLCDNREIGAIVLGKNFRQKGGTAPFCIPLSTLKPKNKKRKKLKAIPRHTGSRC